MRNLVILRGAPGAGKSTWITQNNLQNYTLCADNIRMMAEAPILMADRTNRVISQKNDDYVWALLFELLEKRMTRGELIVVDATHSRSTDFSRYKKLAEKYRYRTYYVDFSDVPIEICKERNLSREEYKRVPERAIDKIYARLKTQCKTSGYVEVSKDGFQDKFQNKPYDFNQWDGIVIFGDIHGCMEPLKEYFIKQYFQLKDIKHKYIINYQEKEYWKTKRYLDLEDFEGEFWQDIDGYEKLYQVSNYGRVKSFQKYNGYVWQQDKILKPSVVAGYLQVVLVKNKTRKNMKIHRLVAEAFIPNFKNLLYVNHLDVNPFNNNVLNLEWCTQKENTNYGLYYGNYNNEIILQFDKNTNDFIKAYISIEEACRQTKIDNRCISKVCKKEPKYLSAGGYKWEYLSANNLKYLINSKNMYVFTGDYIDRGIQNKEVLEFLISIKDEPNVLMLEGNHEKWLWYYANDEDEKLKSPMFKNRTIPQIKDIDPALIRQLYRKLGQMAYFNYGNNIYIITHGGLPYMPNDLQFVATQQLIDGVGDYTVNIDEIFNENMKDTNIYQIHGHRNSFGIDIDEYPHSLNLQGDIELGGSLRVVHLSKNDNNTVNHNIIWFENTVFSLVDDKIEELPFVSNEKLDIVSSLRRNPNIRETVLDNNISSFNFTRDAFENKNWDEETLKSRGLFINTETTNIVARGYNKFFNINEVKTTSMPHLRSKLEEAGKAVAYKKYNGYLGLLSYVNGDLFFASKSTNKGDFASWFKEIFYKQYSEELAEAISNYMIDTNTTFVFEVIDPINDPHIIKNNKREIILLDIIYNDAEFNKMSYDELQSLANNWKMKYKEIVAEFTTYRDLMSYFLEKTNEENFSDDNIEGVVIEIGQLMTKLKFNYYNFWKQMRGLKERVRGKHTVKLSGLTNDIANYFYKFLLTIPEEELNKDIISLRDMFEEAMNNGSENN